MIGPRHLVTLCALLVACPPALAQQSNWSTAQLSAGVTLYTGTAGIGADVVEIAFARAEPGSGGVKILTPRTAFEERGTASTQVKSAIPDGLAMRDFADLTGAVAVLAGGYVSSFRPVQSLGYVQSDSQVTSRSHNSWLVDAMICAKGRDVELGLFQDLYGDRKSYADCLQIGPMLVLDGKRYFGSDGTIPAGAQKLLHARQRQAFVCRDAGGAFVIGVSTEATLEDFIPVLLRPVAQGGIGCQTASRVTGSTTATLATRTDTFGPDKYLLPTAVAVLPQP